MERRLRFHYSQLQLLTTIPTINPNALLGVNKTWSKSRGRKANGSGCTGMRAHQLTVSLENAMGIELINAWCHELIVILATWLWD
jgi:hypothetical protein